MNLASRVTEYRGTAQMAGRAGAKPCKGTAIALTGGWVHQSSQDMAPAQDSLGMETRVVASQEVLALAIAELIKDKPAYFPPEPIYWGGSDFQLIQLDFLWIYEDFIILRRTHLPSVPPLGQPWIEFHCIPLSDVDAIAEFRTNAQLIDTNLQKS